MIAVLAGLLVASLLTNGVLVLFARAIDADREALRLERHDLTGQMLAMRRDGFAIAKPATVRQSPDPESEGLERAVRSELAQRSHQAQRVFLENAVTDIRRARPDVSQAAAEKEARQLLQATLDDDSPT